MMRLTTPVLISAVAILFLFSLGAYKLSQKNKLVILSGLTMGTTYTVKIYAPEIHIDRIMLEKIINDHLNTINNQMSTYIETSNLSLFNQSMTKDWVTIPVELYIVIKEALRVSQLSNHAFDITIGPAVDLWGFGPPAQSNSIPDETAISQALNKVGPQYFELRSNPYAIRKHHPELMIDLSALAKGFAVDIIANQLDDLAINNYMVEIGGEIKTKGRNPNNNIWRVGIEKPVSDHRLVQTTIALNNASLATSGDYRNYFEKNGIRYSHTIDPKTGKPVTHNLASVTVIHSSAMTADAMATALLVLGYESGFQLAVKEQLATLFIIRDGENFTEIRTPQLENYIHRHLTQPEKTKYSNTK